MSVINNVLRDLENRKSRFTPIDIAPLTAPAAAGRRSRPVLWMLPILLLLAVAGGWVYLQQPLPVFRAAAPLPSEPVAPAPEQAVAAAPPAVQDWSVDTSALDRNPKEKTGAALRAAGVPPQAATPVDAAPAVASVAASAPTAAAGATGNQIIGLQLRESVDEMRMEFLLRERAVAYLKERGQDHFSYHLRAVDSQIAAPRMRDNRWLRSLEISAAGSGVDIEFTTAPEILVETRQGLLEGEPIWSISLRRAPPAPEPEPAIDAPQPASASGLSAANADAEGELAPLEADVAQPAAVAGRVTDQAPAQTPAARAPEQVKLDIRAAASAADRVDRLEQALELIKARRVAEAEAVLRELLGGPEDYQARQRLLALYQRERQPRRFEQLLAESLRRYPADASLQTAYAQLLVSSGAYHEAIELLASQSSLDANQLALVAASYQRLGRHLDAVRHYRLALAQDAANARNWIALGISLEQDAAHADALQSYQRAAALGGLEPELQTFVEQRSAALKRALD